MLLRGTGDRTEVLLQLRGPGASYMVGRWACGAAGHVELGESVAAAAAREAREELGIELDADAISPLCTLQRTEPGNDDPIEQRADFFVVARRWAGEPTDPGAGEVPGAALVPAGRPAGSPMVPHEEVVLRALAQGEVPAFLSLGF